MRKVLLFTLSLIILASAASARIGVYSCIGLSPNSGSVGWNAELQLYNVSFTFGGSMLSYVQVYALGGKLYSHDRESSPYIGFAATRGLTTVKVSQDNEPDKFKRLGTYSVISGFRWLLGEGEGHKFHLSLGAGVNIKEGYSYVVNNELMTQKPDIYPAFELQLGYGWLMLPWD